MPSVLSTRRAVLATALALAAWPALAAPAAEAFIRQLQTGVDRAAPAGRPGDVAAVSRLIERAFDLEAIARAVLGARAATATPAQVRRLARAFGNRMARETLERRRKARGAARIVRSRPAGPNEWLVYTSSERDRQDPLVVAWRVRRTAGGLRIVDVLRDGASLVSAQRRDLQTALRSKSLDVVIAQMEQRYPAPAG